MDLRKYFPGILILELSFLYTVTPLLSGIMSSYSIASLKDGKKQDKLGDVFQDFVAKILSDSKNLSDYKSDTMSNSETEACIFKSVLNCGLIRNKDDIIKIETTFDIRKRDTGGNAKTDLIAIIKYKDDSIFQLPIGIKQTTARKVAVAEFSVETIAKEVNISDPILINYLMKHQRDGSAKNFLAAEKQELSERIKPYAESFVRWVISGSRLADETDLRCPKLFIQFDLTKELDIKSFSVMSANEYIKKIMTTKNGKMRKGGFGTGLSWTYATGSKGFKIQFKA